VHAPYYPFNNSFIENFVIGATNCNGAKGYCNGPLKPATAYRIKIRAFTTPTAYTDTAYSYPVQTGRIIWEHIICNIALML